VSATLALEGVAVSYGKRRALDGVSLSVERGEIVTLLGANGSGKSTALRAISGLVRPARGRIVYEGRDITQAPADAIVAAGITHVPEGREIFPEFTVLENLLVGGHTAARRDVAARVEGAFELFPVLRARRAQLAGTLSGGEQQMLAIGRALMARPRLILFDEPSLGLAPTVVETTFEIIADIRRRGTTVLMVEQNAYLALRMADRGYVMETGRIVLAGPAAELLADDHVRRAYLGA